MEWLIALGPVVVVLLGAIGWLYRHDMERLDEVQRKVSDKKYETYIALLDIFFDLLKATKGGKPIEQTEVAHRMIDAGKNLLIFGSDEVIQAYQKLTVGATSNRIRLTDWGEVVIAIRRDMGNKGTVITADHVLRQFITDYEDAKSKGLL